MLYSTAVADAAIEKNDASIKAARIMLIVFLIIKNLLY